MYLELQFFIIDGDFQLAVRDIFIRLAAVKSLVSIVDPTVGALFGHRTHLSPLVDDKLVDVFVCLLEVSLPGRFYF